MISGMIALSIPISNHMIVQLVNDREQSNIEEVIRGFREFISSGMTSVELLT
jgi:hypothetical protein